MVLYVGHNFVLIDIGYGTCRYIPLCYDQTEHSQAKLLGSSSHMISDKDIVDARTEHVRASQGYSRDATMRDWHVSNCQILITIRNKKPKSTAMPNYSGVFVAVCPHCTADTIPIGTCNGALWYSLMMYEVSLRIGRSIIVCPMYCCNCYDC